VARAKRPNGRVRFANQPASNNGQRFGDVPLVEPVEGEFAQLMALFAAWRAEIDSEPFPYSDEDLLRAWLRPVRSRFDHRGPSRAAPDRPEPPTRPHGS
jgi:hypothetical protein